eukprot:COSAG04_NODE_45_length_31617_cov_47.863284_20_plen_94_part_00
MKLAILDGILDSLRIRFELGLFDKMEQQPLAKLMPEDVIGSAETRALNLKAALQVIRLIGAEGLDRRGPPGLVGCFLALGSGLGLVGTASSRR